jgi:hypothetical protein
MRLIEPGKPGGSRAPKAGGSKSTRAENFAREGTQDAPGRARATGAGVKVAIRCGPAWAAWLEAAAAHCDLSVSDYLAQAAARLAERVGYHRRAPRRVRGQVDQLGTEAQRHLFEHDER